MNLARFDPDRAQPLEGGKKATASPALEGAGVAMRVIELGKRGETGRRESPHPVILVVVSGEGQVRVSGEIADIKPGDTIAVPSNVMYWAWTTGDSMTLALIELTGG